MYLKGVFIMASATPHVTPAIEVMPWPLPDSGPAFHLTLIEPGMWLGVYDPRVFTADHATYFAQVAIDNQAVAL
jgi:hypothetical protein